MSTKVVKTFERDASKVEVLVRSKAFWILFMILGFGYPIYRSMNRTLPPSLPVLFQLPEYSFTNEFGKAFGTNELKGRFYIASFMFTSCPTVCGELMAKKQKIQKRVRGLGTKVAMVSFTVDPEVDTPKVLHKYARGLQTNPHVWTFVTADLEKTKSLLIDGFKVPVGDKKETSVYDIAHSEKLVLVDDQGQVRGYYSTDKNSINKLMIDLGLLVNRM